MSEYDWTASEERAHWYYDVPMSLVWDIARTLR